MLYQLISCVCCLCLLALTAFTHSSDITILTEPMTPFGKIWIAEYNGLRCLTFSDPNITNKLQSCFLPNNPQHLALGYSKMLLGALYLQPNPKKILILGLGGGTMVSVLRNLLPESKIDVVEINPDLPDLAVQYFNFQPNTSTKIIISDALEFVRNSSELYDLIIFDIFDSEGTPPVFLTTEFMLKLKKMLSGAGVIAINTLVNSVNKDLEHELYANVFPSKVTLLNKGNRILLIPRKPIPSLSIVQKNANFWDKAFDKVDVTSHWLISRIEDYKVFR